MTKAEFQQQAQPIMATVEAAFNNLFAQDRFVVVTFEGVKWCMTGERKDGEFVPTAIWLASDLSCTDISDYLKGIVIDDLADLAANK